MTQTNEFEALGLSEATLQAISRKGFETPSPIQKLTIPVLLRNENDIIGQAQTGTGKTAAFGLPILEQIKPGKGGPQALILVPTRELALQVTDELLSFKSEKVVVSAIYGGASMEEQLRRLKKGIDIVVGTPGRILDHLRRGTLDLSKLKWLVLDEADEMLNMGFIDDVDDILSHTPEERRVLLFSATMPNKIAALAKKYMRDVEMLKVENKNLITDLTDQIYFEVREGDKFDALTRIIDVEPHFYAIVFCRTKVAVDELVNKLLERGYAAEGLHGDVSQALREKILRKFKRKFINILVATDVAARGIDVNNLTHVINYSLPQDSESYVHRIGRTGRAGNQGTAITFISNAEYRQFTAMKREVKADIRKQEIPSVKDVIAMKKKHIVDEIAEAVENDSFELNLEMAHEILENYPPEVALSCLLKIAFKDDLDERSYPEIRSFSVDRKGTARLFIAVGKRDGYTNKRLVELLKRECSISDRKINDVKVMDEFSFVTIPFEDAENVTRQLNKLGRKDRPIAEITKDEGSSRKARSGGSHRSGKEWERPERKSRRGPSEGRSSRSGRSERSARPAKRKR